MRILFDHNVPAPLLNHLLDHAVVFADQRGWSTIPDGRLLTLSRDHDFEVFITADQNIPYQHPTSDLPFAIIVLANTDWRVVQRYVRKISAAVKTTPPGTWFYIDMPKRHDR
jgi:hypothetical protein